MKSRATGRNAVKLSSDMLKLFCPWLRSSSDYLPARTPGRRGNTEELLLLRGELSFFRRVAMGKLSMPHVMKAQ